MRCCDNGKDCDMSHSTYGCRALIKVGVDTETMPTDTETTISFKPKPTKSSGDRTHFHPDPTHLVLYTPIIAKTTGPLNVKIRSSAIPTDPMNIQLPSSDVIVPSADVTTTTIAVPTATSIRFPTEITAKTSDISNSCSQPHFQAHHSRGGADAQERQGSYQASRRRSKPTSNEPAARLQRVKEALKTYQLCDRIARIAATKKTTDTNLEKYRIEQEEKAHLEEEVTKARYEQAHKEKEREEGVEREAENTKDTDDASDEYRKDQELNEEVERETQDQKKTDDES
ncbi:hypothetical protein BG000_006552 [Podila horticola]|nr:hypothetical protein BG000_006552 [Podila horticola]